MQMHTYKLLTLSLCLSLVGACDSGDKPADEPAKTAKKPAEKPAEKPVETEPESQLDPKVAKAVAIAKEIEGNMDDTDAILEKHGLDRDSLEQMMYEIARDPTLSNAYEQALIAG